MLTPRREAKFKRVVAARQPNLTVVLENVHDPHNIGAVLRSCDSVGVKEIFVLYTEAGLSQDRLVLGKRTSAGARRWIDVNFYTDTAACFEHLRRDYQHVLATKLSKKSVSLYDLDLTQSVALVFGNEHKGLSDQALKFSTGNFLIPQVGMVESLNISVACAVSLYEAFRQRNEKGYYSKNPLLSTVEQQALLDEYCQRHYSGTRRRSVKPMNQKT